MSSFTMSSRPVLVTCGAQEYLANEFAIAAGSDVEIGSAQDTIERQMVRGQLALLKIDSDAILNLGLFFATIAKKYGYGTIAVYVQARQGYVVSRTVDEHLSIGDVITSAMITTEL